MCMCVCVHLLPVDIRVITQRRGGCGRTRYCETSRFRRAQELLFRDVRELYTRSNLSRQLANHIRCSFNHILQIITSGHRPVILCLASTYSMKMAIEKFFISRTVKNKGFFENQINRQWDVRRELGYIFFLAINEIKMRISYHITLC